MTKTETALQLLKYYEAEVEDLIEYAHKDIEKYKDNACIKASAQMMKATNEMSLTRIRSLLEILGGENEFISTNTRSRTAVLQIDRKR